MLESLITGGVCNGRGDIVHIINSTQVACRCFPRFSGGSDFFDTRFAVPDHEEDLSLTCSSSVVGETVVWGLVLAGVLLRFIQVAKIWQEKRHLFTQRNSAVVERHAKSRTREFRAKMRNFAIALLTFDLVVLTPVTITASALKISGQVMGTNVAVTLFYVFIPIFFQLENSLLANEEFNAITRFVPQAERVRISTLRNRLEGVSWISYMLGALAPTMAALALDKTLGPLENYEYVTILVRNLFVVLWSGFASVANYVVLTRFEHLLGSGVHSSSLEAVEHMRNANQRLVRMYVLISLVYLVFCIPQLWAFQTYCYGLIVFVGTFRHPGKAFKSMHTFSSSKGTDSKINNSKLSPLTTNNNDQVMSEQQSSIMPRVSDMGGSILHNMKSTSDLKATPELRASIRDL